MHGMVGEVPIFGSDGPLGERVLSVYLSTFWQFRFLKNGSGGSAFGSWKNGSDSCGFRFQFGSWAIATILLFFSASHHSVLSTGRIDHEM